MALPRFDTGQESISTCFGCRGCARPVSVTPHRQLSLLTNTLILPLLGFVVGSIVANYFYDHEVSQVAGAIIGFTIGLFCCRPVTSITEEAVDHA